MSGVESGRVGGGDFLLGSKLESDGDPPAPCKLRNPRQGNALVDPEATARLHRSCWVISFSEPVHRRS